MRYRITLGNSFDLYEVDIFRDFPQREGGKHQPITMNQSSSITEVFNKVRDEMKGQTAFHIRKNSRSSYGLEGHYNQIGNTLTHPPETEHNPENRRKPS